MKERYFSSAASENMNHRPDSGAVNAIGNGETMVYGKGPEWMQVLGAPYSSPSVFSMVISDGEKIECSSSRIKRTGNWVHTFPCGTIIDAASRSTKCILRHWSLNSPVKFRINSYDRKKTEITGLFDGCTKAFLITVPANACLYNDYPIINQLYMLLVWDGECLFDDDAVTLIGNGTLRVCGGQDYGECFRTMKNAAAIPFDTILEESAKEDKAFIEECEHNRAKLKEHPLTARLTNAIEDTLFMIRAQQDSSGGILAGYNYHLAYIRDQYGTFRGLLEGGAVSCAKGILEFYRGVFEKSGKLCNAQAMRVDGIFHVHENDTVEITGYLLLQAADYLNASNDLSFFSTLIPMLDWALGQQLGQLTNGMLPFNGDETYIAGGIVPRTIINHGSIEATMLFITGGTRYLAAREKVAENNSLTETAKSAIAFASSRFEENFRRNGRYVTNSKARLDICSEPEFRHGVCLICGAFGWVHHTGKGVYACAGCACNPTSLPEPDEYELKSTFLMAPFMKTSLIPNDTVKKEVGTYLDDYEKTGILPSLINGTSCPGYDYGLLLFAAAETSLEADGLLEEMLDLQDECGAWPEYFVGKEHRGTRCRPWESAINITGAIEYLRER